MKKWIIIFVVCYSLVGIFLYLSHQKENYPSYKPDQALTWNVNHPNQGNYTTPPALHKPEDSNDRDQITTLPNERLMSFFASIQQGDVRSVTTFINPAVAHQDFQQKDIKSINQKLDYYVNTISKNRTIQQVELSKGRKIDEEHYEFDVTLHFPTESAQLKNIPMIHLQDSNSWYIDQPLSRLAAALEKNPKN